MTIAGQPLWACLRRGLLLAALALLASQTAGAQEIGVLLSSNKPAYDRAVAGFRAAFRERHPAVAFVSLGEVDGARSQEAVGRFHGACLLAVGSRALTALVAANPPQPLAFTMVLEPVDGGFLAATSPMRARMAGSALNLSVETQLQVLHRLFPHLQRVGGLTLQGRFTDWDRLGQHTAHDLHMVWVPVRPARVQDIPEALDAVGPVEMLIPAPDPDLLVPRAFRIVSRLAQRSQFGLVTPSVQFVRAGALMGMEASWSEVGRLAAQQAERLLAGERNISPMVLYPPVGHLWVNGQRAHDLRLMSELRPDPLLQLWEGR